MSKLGALMGIENVSSASLCLWYFVKLLLVIVVLLVFIVLLIHGICSMRITGAVLAAVLRKKTSAMTARCHFRSSDPLQLLR